MNAIIELKFHRPVCLELYRENKVLGRFMLRYSGKTIAAGMISEVRSVLFNPITGGIRDYPITGGGVLIF